MCKLAKVPGQDRVLPPLQRNQLHPSPPLLSSYLSHPYLSPPKISQVSISLLYLEVNMVRPKVKQNQLNETLSIFDCLTGRVHNKRRRPVFMQKTM